MKIIHCINSLNIGGIERLVIELAIEQKKNGIDVSIMLDKMEGHYSSIINENNIPIIHSKLSNSFWISFKQISYLKKIYSSFDLIHLHNFSLTRSIASKKFITIYTIHGLSKRVRKENVIKTFFRESLKKYFLNNVSYFIANSEYTLRNAINDYSLTNTKKKIILNGIQIQDFPNVISNDKQFIIGLITRFTERKRIDLLIECFEIYLKKGGTGQLIIIGNGKTYSKIEGIIKSKNLTQKIKLLGYKTNVHDYYSRFDVATFPSQNEPFGLVALEAYLHGKPVIVFSDSGGLTEIVAPLEIENIVDSTTDFANRLLFYEKNKEEIIKEASNRINYVKNNFSISKMERAYYKVYKEFVK